MRIHYTRRNNSFYFRNNILIQPFIGIEIQHPVRIRLLQCEVSLGGEIIRPRAKSHLRAVLFGKLYRAIRAARVDDHDFVRAFLRVFYHGDDIVFFITSQNQNSE